MPQGLKNYIKAVKFALLISLYISIFPQQAILFVSENLLNFYLSIYLKLAIQEKLYQIVLNLKSVQD